jgi:glycosyltransferase involved in cell wall biosynthesis
MRLSVIIPVYNEEMTIGEVIDRVARVDIGEIEMEIVVANDGSTDGSQLIVESRLTKQPHLIRLYNTPINLGKGAAVRLGLYHATGDVILIQDADLELDPDEYANLLCPIIEGRTQVVYGSRFLNQKNHRAIPQRTRWANRFLTLLTNMLFRVQLTDMETAYKVFRREVLDGVRLRCVHFDFEPEITGHLARSGHQIVEVPISYNPRRADEGKKISWIDGLEAIYTLLRVRFFT